MQDRKNISQGTDTIDFDKLRMILRKNLVWLLVIVIGTNLASWLYLRYTKTVYEAESELKLDIKQDATEFGIKNLQENQNLNIISGEIEQITSKLFYNRVLDSIDLWVSYHSVGQVLNSEMYHASPFKVQYSTTLHPYLNLPIDFNFTGPEEYRLKIGEQVVTGRIGEKLKLNDIELLITKTFYYGLYHEDNYFFILHSRENLLNYLDTHASVEPLNYDANTIKISFSDYNAFKARDIANKIDSMYLNYSNEQKNLTNKQKIGWINEELGQIEGKMEDYENYFENFTIQNKSSDLDSDLRKTIGALYAIDSQRFQLNRRLSDINGLLDQFAANNYSISLSNRQYLPSYLDKQIESLQLMVHDIEKLGLSYNESTFAFKQKQSELEAQRNSVFGQISGIKKEWSKTLIELNQQKDRLEKRFASMPDKNTQFSKNQRFYKLYEEFYLSMMQAKAEFEIAQAGSTPDFKILSPATMPTAPIYPQSALVYGIGLSSGIVLCILFIGLIYLADNRVTNVTEIEKNTSVPVLAVIPESRHTSKTPFHVLDNPKSIVSEAIRTLRTNLDFFAVTGKSKTISISSTIGGEGKSFLALNLGGVIAMSKKKVVLLDLDMRKPKLNIPFTIPDSQKGVSTALIRKYEIEECIVPTGLENFDYIPAGPHPPNPSELLMNGDFTHVLDRLKELYEFVIIDTPPVGLVTDGIMAMKKTDVTIYVVRANYSKKDFLQNIERIQRLHKIGNISVVFNALPSSNKLYGYGYYEDKTPLKKSWKYILRG
ncbi:MAG TPA: polysaccharide biosynthesis tyrosine autokinase [Cyclobacteriaceae bacterium]|nr:polysaccharide biosynthesis tyrosine autokinase [Cyclobacteriaceae bacterium]